jgi:hypothetical protein
MTYAQIAVMEGISPTRARQVEQRALAKIALGLARLIRRDIEGMDPKCQSKLGKLQAGSDFLSAQPPQSADTLPDAETAMQFGAEIPHRPKWR